MLPSQLDEINKFVYFILFQVKFILTQVTKMFF